tara:strand:+ start:6280 stop:14463 length:8184 start_codon:yes stop_codon:yes gene_type:complete
MITTSFTKVKIHEIIQSQVPQYVDDENPLFGEFLKQYYISQEFQGGVVDIADNLVEYKSLDYINNEVMTGFTSTTSYANGLVDTIYVDSTKGWPRQWGLLKINDEIITYTGIGSTSFTGCVRGFSGIEKNSRTNAPEYLTFTATGIGTHQAESRVTNLSNVFLKEFLKKLKVQFLPGFSERPLNEELNQSNFIRQAKDFYKSKGTEEAFKILFGALYGEPVEMIQPSKYLVRPSDADYIVNDVLVCDIVSGDALSIEGQSLIQDTTPVQTSGSVYSVERCLIGGKTYYKVALSKGTTVGKFEQAGKTFLTKSTPALGTILNVDSTVGFDTSGSVSFEDRTFTYTDKNYTQFLGVSSITSPCGIGSTVTAGLFAYSYENGDLAKKVNLNVLGVLSKFVGSAINQQEESSINVKSLGKKQKDPRWKTFIHNTASKYGLYGIDTIAPGNYRFTLNQPHDLFAGDTIDIIDGDNAVVSGTITLIISDSKIEVSTVVLDTTKTYYFRRNVKTQLGYTADVQNSYSNGDEVYVASNSLPHWDIDPQKRIRSFDNIGIAATTTRFTSSNHNLNDGDLVVYSYVSGIGTLSNLDDNVPYYVKSHDPNTLSLAYSADNVRRGQFINIFEGNDLSGISTHTLTPQIVYGTDLGAQKILRRFKKSEFGDVKTNTVQGAVGLFANGVEAYSYKSTDKVYHGPLLSVEVLNQGSGYDVVNPPTLSIVQDGHTTGVTSATCIAQVEGTITEVLVDGKGLDYEEIPNVNFIGGNSKDVIIKAKMKIQPQEVEFDSTSSGGIVNTHTDRCVFATPHGFKNGEKIIYSSGGTTEIGIGITPGNLVDSAPYFVIKLDDFNIHLAETEASALAGINSVPFITNGGGIQKFTTTDRRQIVDKVLVVNGGTVRNRSFTIPSSSINHHIDTINIPSHGFDSGEIVKYSAGVVAGNLTNNTEYYVNKVDNDSLRLSTKKDLSDLVSISNSGAGSHTFQDPPISIEIDGRQGITTSAASASPIVRGKITGVHVQTGGTGYGSTVINDKLVPSVDVVIGKDAYLQPLITNGQIDQIVLKDGGKNFFSTPDVIITGDGTGAKAKAIISGGKIISINMIDKGMGYTQSGTTCVARTPGKDSIFSSKIKTWTVNQVERYAKFGDVEDDDGFYEIAKDNGNPYVNYYVPRKLRFFKDDLGLTHSPILGYAYDGNPIYGPYANVDGALKYIESSYKPLSGQRPDGPNISKFPAGFFIEDFTYIEGFGDLDEHNGRFAATPEYPNGVYAYYTTVDQNLTNNPSDPFNGARKPKFPYIVGDSYHSKLDEYNIDDDTNQKLDPVKLGLVRNTNSYNIPEYEFVSNGSNNTLLNAQVLGISDGSLEKIDIIDGGKNYNVDDKLVFDNTDTDGFGAIGDVVEIVAPEIDSFSTQITTFNDVVLTTSAGKVIGFTTTPHGISNQSYVKISGISTDTHTGLEAITKLSSRDVRTGLGITMDAVGATTSILLSEYLPDVTRDNKFQIDDIVLINSEQLKIYGFDTFNNKLQLIRAQNGSVAAAHTFGSNIVRLEKEFTYDLQNTVDLDTPSDVVTYFDAANDVGIGLTFGPGIAHTITVNTKSKNVPTRAIYIPHQFRQGEKLLYSPGAGTSLTYQTDAMKRVNTGFKSPLPPEVYVQVLTNDTIGIVTTQSGIGSDLQRVMFDTNTGIGNTHFFKTQRGAITGTIEMVGVAVTTKDNHTLRPDDVIDLTVVSSATSAVTITYNSVTRFVSIGSSINPPLNVTIGDTLEFDTSSNTLSDKKLEFFLDQDYQKQFVGSGVSAIEVTTPIQSGVTGGKTRVHFTEQVPSVLYYKLSTLQGTDVIEIDKNIVDYSKIIVSTSKYTGRHSITSVTANTYEFNIFDKPERVGYTSISQLTCRTTSKNVTGGVGKVRLTSGGVSYEDLPNVSVASTTGSSASFSSYGSGIGSLSNVRVIDFGYDYPSDKTLRPEAEVSQVVFLKDNYAVDSVAITSTGKKYVTPPNLVVYNSKTNTTNQDAKFSVDLNGGAVGSVRIISRGGNLASGDSELFAVDNSNGVGIVSATYSSPNVTLKLQTPNTGFTTANPLPFAVGDKVFVENVGVSSGLGFNSADHEYTSFVLTGINTAFGQIDSATLTYSVDDDPGFHDFQKFGSVSNDKDIAKFKLNLREGQFLDGEPLTDNVNVITGNGKKLSVLRVSSLVGLNTGDQVRGRYSLAGGTIESMDDYEGYFEVDSTIEKRFGWEKDTGKLSEFYQRVQDNDYYQNFAYSLKSFVGISSWSEPVDSLAHIAGFKKHSDLLINSEPVGTGASVQVGASTATDNVVLINSYSDIDCKHHHDLVHENTDSLQSLSNEIVFNSFRAGDSILCKTNRVLEIDDISPDFYNDPDLINSVEIDQFDMGSVTAIKYYAQVVLDTSLGLSFNIAQYSEFVASHDGTTGFMNTYSEVSDSFDLGEFSVSTNGGVASINFTPYNNVYTYDITFYKEVMGDAVGTGLTSHGNLKKIGVTSAIGAEASPPTKSILDIDTTKFKSGSITVAAKTTGEKEIDEYTWLVNGANNLEFTNFGTMDAGTDCGTFLPTVVSNVLKFNFTAPANKAVTISTLTSVVGVATTVAGTGIPVTGIEVGDSKLDGSKTTIVASGSPVATIISSKSFNNYTSARYHVEIHNTTDSTYSVFVVAANAWGGNSNYSKYNNLSTSATPKRDIRATDMLVAGTSSQLRFTPLANKAYVVRVSELVIDKPDSVASNVTFTI